MSIMKRFSIIFIIIFAGIIGIIIISQFRYQGEVAIIMIDGITDMPIEDVEVRYIYEVSSGIPIPVYQSPRYALRTEIVYTDANGYVVIPGKILKWTNLLLQNPEIIISASHKNYYSSAYTYSNEILEPSLSSQKISISLFPEISTENYSDLWRRCLERIRKDGVLKINKCMFLYVEKVLEQTKNITTCYDLPSRGPNNAFDCLNALMKIVGKDKGIVFCEELYEIRKKDVINSCSEADWIDVEACWNREKQECINRAEVYKYGY